MMFFSSLAILIGLSLSSISIVEGGTGALRSSLVDTTDTDTSPTKKDIQRRLTPSSSYYYVESYNKEDSSSLDLELLLSAFATRTTRVGGQGGDSFDDSHYGGDFGRISYIDVRVGSVLDYIGIGYANGRYIGHGGSGGNLHRISLGDDENIVSVSGRAAKHIDQISFTNQEGKTYGPYGGEGGEPFHFDFGKDNALLYIFGRSYTKVDQLGFAYFEPLKAPEQSTWFSPRYGGNGGNRFDDFQASDGLIGKITELKVRAGKIVDSIEVCYKDSGCKKHGGNGGRQYSFKLDDDEYVTEIRGRSGSKVDQIQFVLSSGRVSPQYGGFGGRPFEIKRDNHVVSHFYGRSYSKLDQIGAFFSEARPTRIEIIDMEFDIDTAKLLAAEPKSVANFFLTNDTSEPQRLEKREDFKTTEEFITSVAETHGASVEVTFKKEFDGFIKKASLEVGFGYTYDKTVTTEEKISLTRSHTYILSAVVGPGKTTRATIVVKEGIFDVRWTATAHIYYSNSKNFTEKEITGELRGVAVSSIEGKYEDDFISSCP